MLKCTVVGVGSKCTLPRLVLDALDRPRERAFAERRHGAEFTYVSAQAMRQRIASIACALRDCGLVGGDRVALIADNRLDWIAVDLGILAAGCVSVPIFVTLAADQLAYVLRDCEPKLIFVETSAQALRVGMIAIPGTPILAFDGDGLDALPVFEARGAELYAADPVRFTRMQEAIDPDDLAVLMYTSGTTGGPKGVMLSHDNIASNAVSAWTYGLAGMTSDSVGISVLPYAHIMEHTNMIGYIFSGLTYYVTVPERLMVDMLDARPHVMTVVPRLLERVLVGILARARSAGVLRGRLVAWALEIARTFMNDALDSSAAVPLRLRLEYAIAQKLVLSKIRPALGLDRLRFFVSGSAPLHRDTALTFAGAGIVICEGYGQTETSPVVCVNRVVDNRYGTVGKPIPGVEVRIAVDGEILVRGPNVMRGYFHQNDSPLRPDGWLMTGDVGALDADGYLRITDRKRELFKTSGGKYIAPMRVEMAIKRSTYISQVMVVGNARPYPLAVVAPNWEIVRNELRLGENVATAALMSMPNVREFLRAEVFEQTKELAVFEQVRRIAILPQDLTMEDGDISPTMKIKRRVVESKYAKLIDAAYADR